MKRQAPFEIMAARTREIFRKNRIDPEVKLLAALLYHLGLSYRSVSLSMIPDSALHKFLDLYHPTKIAMEVSTSTASIYRELTRYGYEVILSHPLKTRLIAESRIKTDLVDSKVLAELLRLDALPVSYVPPEEISSLREMVRRRAYLVRERTKLRVKIRDCLVYNGIRRTKDADSEESNGLFTIDGVKWLQSLNLEPVNMYLRILESLDREIDALSDVLKEKASDDEDVKLLTTIPGIGYYSALLIKSEIGEIVRFPKGEKLCSYAGLVPSVRASGGYAKYGSITKQGSKWLRWIIVEAAHSHAKHDTSISRFYHSLAQRKGKQVAAVATARKLLLCCYSVLKNRRPYYDQAELE
jgi:transposase